jgi:hypothetical protein
MIDSMQRAPRPGGRAAAQRAAREFPTQGATALRPQVRDRPAVAPTGPRLQVAPPPPVSRPRVTFVALVLLLVVGGVLGILVVNTKIAENSFRLDRLTKQQAALDVQQQSLEREIAKAEAPGSLAAAARKLGLVDSGPPAYIRLQDGKVIGIPQPAGGAPAVTSDRAARR